MATATPLSPATREENPSNEAAAPNQDVQVVAIYVDENDAKQELANHWKWLMAGGIVSVVAGTLAFMAPVVATATVATFIAVLLLVVGSANLAGLFFAPKGMKLDSFLVGVVQVLLAAVIAFYPFASIVSMTIVAASVLMVEGILRIGLSIAARDIPGWGWTLTSGICTVAVSGLIFAGLPGAAMWAIGLLVGVCMVANGGAKIGVAVEGRRLAKAETAP